MISAKKIKQLLLASPIDSRGFSHISAASGLVFYNDQIYVIADDELHLAVFSLDSSEPGLLYRIYSHDLPLDLKCRKKQKPDHETLIFLPPDDLEDDPSLLAVPSGSKTNRTSGVRIFLSGPQRLPSRHLDIDFSPIFTKLNDDFMDLNIEGAVLMGEKLKLFQRGNGKSGKNAIIDLDFKAFNLGLINGSIPEDCVRAVNEYDLGELHGIKLGFTDATVLPTGEILFVAAAEGGKDTYEDGTCAGSVIGLIDKDGKLKFMDQLEPSMKAEGISVRSTTMKDYSLENLVVTDIDDPHVPAVLYCCAPKLDKSL